MISTPLRKLDTLADTLSSLTPNDDLQRYCQDASGLTASGKPALVLRPRNTAEVSEIVCACHHEGRSLTIQGGRTGMAGAAVPNAGDVVLSLEHMNRIEALDTLGGTVTVQAGVILEALCRQVEEQGWYFPLDCGARGSCQIGGNIATNAGGNRVLRYGTMRELVLGLEVVLADGTVLSMMNKGLKNNTGLDLKHLFIGTEGTLGIITRAVLRLFPKPDRRDSALVALDSFDQLTSLLKAARAHLPSLSSFEVMWNNYLQAAARVLHKPAPFDGAYALYVLIETEGMESGTTRHELEAFLSGLIDTGLARDVILPQTHEQAAQLWKLRDAIGEILLTMQPYVAFDVGIPLHELPGFIERVTARLTQTWPQAQNLLFGHLGDGNLHLSTGPHAQSDLYAVESTVYQEVERVGGSISAEHGIGRIKKPFLHHSRSADELALMADIKRLLDGDELLNRQRLLDL
ncbi:FAD-binding oxidoreductase [Alcaligenaceae bacterium CGII-47]|nr:FAD-binding oxidoreductase [Alcaligenaceae bacterium CGII-47]